MQTHTLSRRICLVFLVLTAPTAAVAGGFCWPVAGEVVLAFGQTYQTADGVRTHRGIDIAVPPGTAVVAAADGIVSFVGYTPAGSGTVSIALPDGLRTTYLGIEAFAVRAGETVAAGTVIGAVAENGDPSTSRPHLHFGIRRGKSTYLDPIAFLPPSADQRTRLADDAAAAPAATVYAYDAPNATADAAAPSVSPFPVPSGETRLVHSATDPPAAERALVRHALSIPHALRLDDIGTTAVRPQGRASTRRPESIVVDTSRSDQMVPLETVASLPLGRHVPTPRPVRRLAVGSPSLSRYAVALTKVPSTGCVLPIVIPGLLCVLAGLVIGLRHRLASRRVLPPSRLTVAGEIH